MFILIYLLVKMSSYPRVHRPKCTRDSVILQWLTVDHHWSELKLVCADIRAYISTWSIPRTRTHRSSRSRAAWGQLFIPIPTKSPN